MRGQRLTVGLDDAEMRGQRLTVGLDDAEIVGWVTASAEASAEGEEETNGDDGERVWAI
jgi:hypothetical protein